MKLIEFKPSAEADSERGISGEAVLEISGKRGLVPAVDLGDRIDLYGIAVRYQTGKKIWNGTAIYWKSNGAINNVRGPIDNRQRPGITSVVGFYSDFNDKVKSQHVGN